MTCFSNPTAVGRSNSLRFALRKPLLATLLACLLSFSHLWGASVSWLGTTSNDWFTAANWSNAAVPTASDDLSIPAAVPNNPVIGAAGAVAKSVFILGNLTIGSSGTLAVNGAATTGLSISGILTIQPSGILTIDGTGGTGLSIGGTLLNQGSINIGNTTAINVQGLTLSMGTFTNDAGATLAIEQVGSIYPRFSHVGGTFTNHGTVNLGQVTTTTSTQGVSTSGGNFTNAADGIIKIDHSSVCGIFKSTGGTFNNSGVITLGVLSTVGQAAIRTSGQFNNLPGGILNLGGSNVGIQCTSPSAVVTNESVINAATSVNIMTSFILALGAKIENKGCSALINPQGNATYLISGGGTVNNLGGVLIERSNAISTITQNTGLVINLNGGTFNIGNNTNGVLTTSLSAPVWRGCTSSDWFTASNWYGSAVPTAADDAFVLANASYATAIGGPGAVAKSVTVAGTAALNIGPTGTLSISGGANGLTNSGTVNNDGSLTIAGSAHSLVNNAPGQFHNNACGILNLTAPVSIQFKSFVTNAGVAVVNTGAAHTNGGSLTNNGILSYPQGNPISGVVNNETIANAVVSSCSVVSPALTQGSPIDIPISSNWYLDAGFSNSGGTYDPATNTLTPFNFAPNTPTILYFPVNIAGCGQRKASVSVQYGQSAAAPTVACLQAFCIGDNPTVASLVPNGAGYAWYTTQTGGVALAPGTALVNGGDYYVGLTSGGCESFRAHVRAIVTTPAPGHVCVGGCSN